MRSLALFATLIAVPAMAAPPGETPPTGHPPGETPQQPAKTSAPGETPVRAAVAGEPGPVRAAPPALPAVPDDLPEACQPLGKSAASQSREVALSSRVSLASCLAEQSTKGLQLIDAEQSVHELEDAVAPSFGLLDDVIAAGDPAWKVIALHAKGELYSSLAIRMDATVPQPPAGAPDTAYQVHDLRVSMLQPLLEPWRDQARDAFNEVSKAAKDQPALLKNASVKVAVEDSERRLAPGVANR